MAGACSAPRRDSAAPSWDGAVDSRIYGVNFGDPEQAIALGFPVRRWGGNATTRYSWEDDVNNRAAEPAGWLISAARRGSTPSTTSRSFWSGTHRDAHPEPLTYDELWERTVAYATAIKSADPDAKILGPSVWGWCAHFGSGADDCADGPDREAHGGPPLVE